MPASLNSPLDPSAGNPELSPDGDRVGVSQLSYSASDAWLPGVARTKRFTLDPAAEIHSMWSPDGRFLLYRSDLNRGDLMIFPWTKV